MNKITTTGLEPAATQWQEIGEEIVRCVSARDFEGLSKRFHPQVVCRLLIPSGLLTPLDESTLMDKFRMWFGISDPIIVEGSDIARVGDLLHVGYRFRVREEGNWYTVEQQTYSRVEDGKITHFDLLCSGFQPDLVA